MKKIFGKIKEFVTAHNRTLIISGAVALIAIFSLLIFFQIKESKNDTEKITEKNISLQKQEEEQKQWAEQSALVLADDARQFTKGELEKAEAALVAGIKIEDEQNDFFAEKEENPKENYNNPEPYAFPYLDYKSFQIGADQEYLYIKHQLHGVIPNDQPTVKDDKLEGLVMKIEDLYLAGREKYSTLIVNGVSWKCTSHACRAKTTHYVFLDETEESRAKKDAVPLTQIGMVGGGAGTDYVIGAFPLAKIGLKYGQEITFRIGAESGSVKWHHATIDEVLGIPGSKFGKQVVYTIGGNKHRLKIPTKDEMTNFN